MPLSFENTYAPLNGGSVPARRSTSYCAGLSCSRHSSSLFSILVPSISVLLARGAAGARTASEARPIGRLARLGQQRADALPIADFAAVCPREGAVDAPTGKAAGEAGALRPAVDLGARPITRGPGGEERPELRDTATGVGGLLEAQEALHLVSARGTDHPATARVSVTAVEGDGDVRVGCGPAGPARGGPGGHVAAATGRDDEREHQRETGERRHHEATVARAPTGAGASATPPPPPRPSSSDTVTALRPRAASVASMRSVAVTVCASARRSSCRRTIDPGLTVPATRAWIVSAPGVS